MMSKTYRIEQRTQISKEEWGGWVITAKGFSKNTSEIYLKNVRRINDHAVKKYGNMRREFRAVREGAE